MSDKAVALKRVSFGVQDRLTFIGALICIALVTVLTVAAIFVVRDRLQHQTNESLLLRQSFLKQQIGGPAAQWAITNGKLTANGVVMNDNFALNDKVGGSFGGVVILFQGDTLVATTIAGPDGQRGVGAKLAPGPAFDAVVTRGQSYQDHSEILGQTFFSIYEPIKDQTGKQIGVSFVGLPTTGFDVQVARATRSLGIVGGVMAVIACLLFWVAARHELQPIQSLSAVLALHARGHDPGPIAAVARPDEVGEIARSIETLTTSLDQTKALEAERRAELQQASLERRQARIVMADRFDSAVGQVVSGVAASADSLLDSARKMETGIAVALTEMSDASQASAQASTNAQSVAASSEQLSQSIREISQQVSRSAALAGDAQRQTEQTNAQVEALSRAAQEIGSVVQLINEIASQTNLLALNATIEAARAGDAGKGFAVVANEVKNLAAQTTRATDQIGRQITGVQSATTAAVSAIRQIAAKIAEVNMISTGIAAAVEEQGGATSEIARAAQQAADGATTMSRAVAQVNGAAAGVAKTAGLVTHSAGALAEQAEVLRSEVGQFLAGIRAG
jgi:methyl-accepting chemotaxis protein